MNAPGPPLRWVPPPGWPSPPPGWSPPTGWLPDPGWPAAPAGWQFWQPAAGAPDPPDWGRPQWERPLWPAPRTSPAMRLLWAVVALVALLLLVYPVLFLALWVWSGQGA